MDMFLSCILTFLLVLGCVPHARDLGPTLDAPYAPGAPGGRGEGDCSRSEWDRSCTREGCSSRTVSCHVHSSCRKRKGSLLPAVLKARLPTSEVLPFQMPPSEGSRDAQLPVVGPAQHGLDQLLKPNAHDFHAQICTCWTRDSEV